MFQAILNLKAINCLYVLLECYVVRRTGTIVVKESHAVSDFVIGVITRVSYPMEINAYYCCRRGRAIFRWTASKHVSKGVGDSGRCRSVFRGMPITGSGLMA